jgi:uncharacterized Rossmann fold enzyme
MEQAVLSSWWALAPTVVGLYSASKLFFEILCPSKSQLFAILRRLVDPTPTYHHHDYCLLDAYASDKVLLVLNNSQSVSNKDLHRYWQATAFHIAADGAANWLVDQGLVPDVLCGDFDSVLPQTLESLSCLKTIVCQDPNQV